MADGITLRGAWTLRNKKVTVVIAGLDCGDFTLDNFGSIFVPFGSDPNGLLTPSYLNSISNPFSTALALAPITITNGNGDTITVYVPVLIGYTYTSQGQTLRAKTETVTKSPTGGATGKLRIVHNYAASLVNTVGLQVGTSSSNTQPMPFKSLNQISFTNDQMFTGVVFSGLNDSHSYDGQLFWQVTRPYPCTIISLNAYIDFEEN